MPQGHEIAEDALIRGRQAVGEFELTVCTDGSCRFDGGAMFGVVPKSLWQRRIRADENNLVLLGLNTAVVRTGRHTIVIETGIGNKQPSKAREIFQNKELLPASLAAAGIDPRGVDFVVNTHLHFDHCGWNTTLDPDGMVRPTFPNARYFVHAGEVAHGRLQLERDGMSYQAPNYEPLIASGQMTLLSSEEIRSGASAICPGVWVEEFPGHTAQMMAVHIAPERRVESRPPGSTRTPHACYIGDLIPTAHHLDITWAMSFDLDPLRVIEERKRFYARAIPEQWLVLFPHDHNTPMGHVTWSEKGKPILQPAL
jgi:glyoxylase-like metal-dependent hydrolase (beta-lactamase superfamily II)